MDKEIAKVAKVMPKTTQQRLDEETKKFNNVKSSQQQLMSLLEQARNTEHSIRGKIEMLTEMLKEENTTEAKKEEPKPAKKAPKKPTKKVAKK